MNTHFFRTTKRTCSIFLILSVFAITSAFAKGEIAQKKVENKESWKESIEISNLKKGKYNVFETAEDQSGNKSVEGPHNIFVDPESDLPVADISNPRENMHVPGNLNIVGTCVDDDSVKRVEIVLDDDYENIIVAEG